MANYKQFPYLLKDVVELIRLEFDPTNSIKPIYEFGTYNELTKLTQIKKNNKIIKYPLIWLVWEANENIESWSSTSVYNVSPRIFICTNTTTEKTSMQRYDENFIGILFPLWELLKDYLGQNKGIGLFSAQNFTKSDHLLWGESIGFQKNENVIFDTVDAIEIKYTNLEISSFCS